MELVELASARLADFDAEIFEIHHKHKRDAPSGTARSLGEAVAAGRGELKEVVGRSGMTEPREKDELGYAAMRGGEGRSRNTGRRIERHQSLRAEERPELPLYGSELERNLPRRCLLPYSCPAR